MVGDVLFTTTMISMLGLGVVVPTRKRLFGFLSGYFTPKRKVLIAKGVNGIGFVMIGDVVLVVGLYLFAPTVIPSGILSCVQPV